MIKLRIKNLTLEKKFLFLFVQYNIKVGKIVKHTQL